MGCFRCIWLKITRLLSIIKSFHKFSSRVKNCVPRQQSNLRILSIIFSQRTFHLANTMHIVHEILLSYAHNEKEPSNCSSVNTMHQGHFTTVTVPLAISVETGESKWTAHFDDRPLSDTHFPETKILIQHKACKQLSDIKKQRTRLDQAEWVEECGTLHQPWWNLHDTRASVDVRLSTFQFWSVLYGTGGTHWIRRSHSSFKVQDLTVSLTFIAISSTMHLIFTSRRKAGKIELNKLHQCWRKVFQ